jgi:hypothetical protein
MISLPVSCLAERGFGPIVRDAGRNQRVVMGFGLDVQDSILGFGVEVHPVP